MPTTPALALGVVVGGGALLAAALVLVRWQVGALLSIAAGAAIIMFELVETAVVGLDVWLHALGLGPAVAMEGSAVRTPFRLRSAFQFRCGSNPSM